MLFLMILLNVGEKKNNCTMNIGLFDNKTVITF